MEYKKIIQKSIRETFEKNGIKTPKIKEVIKEALYVMAKKFHLTTQNLSPTTKENHYILYEGYVESFNKVSSELDSANTFVASSNHIKFRSSKIDETRNLNAIKLHELYFHNISDLASEISHDSIPYMKLARDFGSFDKWQFDFIATCMSSRSGWGVTVYDSYNKKYMNVVIDDHNIGIPVGATPVIVMDMWEHAYYKDYTINKKHYVTNMMRELNWDVIEERMNIAESVANGNGVYSIRSIHSSETSIIKEPIDPNFSKDLPSDHTPTSGGPSFPQSSVEIKK